MYFNENNQALIKVTYKSLIYKQRWLDPDEMPSIKKKTECCCIKDNKTMSSTKNDKKEYLMNRPRYCVSLLQLTLYTTTIAIPGCKTHPNIQAHFNFLQLLAKANVWNLLLHFLYVKYLSYIHTASRHYSGQFEINMRFSSWHSLPR